MKPSYQLLVAATLAVSVGCGTQQNDTYEGEPLASLQGTVMSASTGTPVESELKVSLLFGGINAAGQETLAFADGPVQGQFPSRFTLDILSPPPPQAFTDPGSWADPNQRQVRIALGAIVAVPRAATGPLTEADIRGVASDYMVVYLDEDVPPGTLAAAFLHGQVTRGYHLMKVNRLTAAEKAVARPAYAACALPFGHIDIDRLARFAACGDDPSFDTLSLAPQDLATPIELNLGLDLDVFNLG